MRKLVYWAVCSFLFMTFTGCQVPVKVTLEGTEQFPPELSGLWESKMYAWQFLIQPDGTIAKARISLGAVEIEPGKTTKFLTWGGGKGVFKPGQWSVTYDEEARELAITVVIEHFYQDVGEGAMEGSIVDLIVGQVSDDFSIWNADWFSSGTYIALMPEPHEFANENELKFRHQLVFRKIEGEKDLLEDIPNYK